MTTHIRLVLVETDNMRASVRKQPPVTDRTLRYDHTVEMREDKTRKRKAADSEKDNET